MNPKLDAGLAERLKTVWTEAYGKPGYNYDDVWRAVADHVRKIVKENTLLLEQADPIGAKTTTAKENNMSAENLNEEIMKADIAVKRGQAELLKAQTRRENAEAARVEKSVKE